MPTSLARTRWKLDLRRSSDQATRKMVVNTLIRKAFTKSLTEHIADIHNYWTCASRKRSEVVPSGEAGVCFSTGTDLQAILAIPLE